MLINVSYQYCPVSWRCILLWYYKYQILIFYDRCYLYMLCFNGCQNFFNGRSLYSVLRIFVFSALYYAKCRVLWHYCLNFSASGVFFQNKFFQIFVQTTACVLPNLGGKRLIFFFHPSILFYKINNYFLIGYCRNRALLKILLLQFYNSRPVNIYTNRGLNLVYMCLYEYTGKLKQYL